MNGRYSTQTINGFKVNIINLITPFIVVSKFLILECLKHHFKDTRNGLLMTVR
jgi:hypothetical protein